ncbi:MAG: SRPBCC domain-containing protein [Gemmatimonadales bacterium]|nr:SRPBCC domain-containing protein [Gemmatimonadales bacterium]
MSPQPPSLSVTRRIQAPPAKVFAALTDPAKILRWWGPDAGPTVSAEADVRPGGRFSVTFRTEDGSEHTSYGVYREVVPDEKLVFTWQWRDEPEGESLVTVVLKAVSGGTELTLTHEGFRDEEMRDSHREGWMGALDKLQDLVD